MTVTSVLMLCLVIFSPVTAHEKPSDYINKSSSQLKILSAPEFDKFIAEPEVRAVYFIKKERSRLKFFRQEYERSALLMKPYSVEFGWVDCRLHVTVKYCDIPDSDNNVYTFRGGSELLVLSVENMFDVDSIMSNMLQIVLLRDVPIIQTIEERDEFLEKHKNKKDILFSYQKAIGTYEHRVLMEVAYAYRHKYKFAITTEFKVIEDMDRPMENEDVGLWLLSCKDSPHDPICGPAKYYGAMALNPLARYVRMLDQQLVYEVNKVGNDPFENLKMNEVVVLHRSNEKQDVLDLAELLLSSFRGQIGILLVDIEDDTLAEDFGYDKSMTLPHLMFAPGTLDGPLKDSVAHMDGAMSDEKAFSFVLGKLEMLKSILLKERDSELGREEMGNIPKDPTDEVETQDDQVAEAVFRMRKVPFDRQHIPALTDKTFPTQTEDADLLVVLFYVQFCPRSMAFLRSYVEASYVLAEEGLHPFAGVDCYDWTDVCAKYNVTIYPTIRVYRKGHNPLEYKGLLDGKALINTIKMLMSGSPILLQSTSDVSSFKTGLFPDNMASFSSVSVLGLFSSDHKEELSSFKEAASLLEGKQVFGYAMGDTAEQVSKQLGISAPNVVVFKQHDTLQPHVVYQKNMSPSLISQFVQESSLPLFPELTAINFPAYFSRKQPFLILFSSDIKIGEREHKVVSQIVQSGRFSELTFAWMNLMDKNGVASAVLQDYDSDAKPPVIALVNHKQGTVHLYSEKISEKSVSSWLFDSMSGKIEPTKILPQGEWKPKNPGYDFLKMMDDDYANKRYDYEPRESGETDEGFGSEALHDPTQEENGVSDLKHSRLFHTTDSRPQHTMHQPDATGKTPVQPTAATLSQSQSDTTEQTPLPQTAATPSNDPHGGEL